MAVRDVAPVAQAVLLAALLAACAAPAYAPCPVELSGALPADAFGRCRDGLLRTYGDLAIADERAFRLQTEWQPVREPPGERRATVFREAGASGLAVVVELRWLSVPLIGVPAWTEPRGDDTAERELARLLREALAAETGAAN